MTGAEWIQRRVDYAYGLLIEALEEADPEAMIEAAGKAKRIADALRRHLDVLALEDRETAETVIDTLIEDVAGYLSMAMKLRNGEYEDVEEEEVYAGQRDTWADL